MPRYNKKKKRTVKTGEAVLPQKGLEVEYRKKLLKLIDDMNKDIDKNIHGLYKKRESEITEDASPSKALTDLLNKTMEKWKGRFSKESSKIASWFIKRSDSNTRRKLGKSLANATKNTVKFKTTKEVQDVLSSLISENVSLIKSIPEKFHTDLNTQVMQSVRAGRDLGSLTETLSNRYNVTKNRARIIARDQNNKATEDITRERNLSLGIEEGIWMHRSGSKTPRKSHQQAHGKKFNLKKGMYIDGEWIFPGEKINCNCTFKPVIPGIKVTSDSMETIIANTLLTEKEREYANYIFEHINNVKKVWNEFSKFNNISTSLKKTMRLIIKNHDKSKLSPIEFEAYRKKFYPEKDETFDLSGFDIAWSHHQKNNKHHWEHWIIDSEPQPMDTVYILEMLCDWGGMSLKFGDSPSSFYEKEKDRIILHKNTKESLEKWIPLFDKIVEGIS